MVFQLPTRRDPVTSWSKRDTIEVMKKIRGGGQKGWWRFGKGVEKDI